MLSAEGSPPPRREFPSRHVEKACRRIRSRPPKRCSRERLLDDGTPNPWLCGTSPRCDHHWHYYFRVNGRRYRASTETHDKRQAEDIEARERSRILDGRHGIRRQPDITFKQFAINYLRDHAGLHKKSAKRDREILKTLNRFFASAILHEITSHRIEQFNAIA